MLTDAQRASPALRGLVGVPAQPCPSQGPAGLWSSSSGCKLLEGRLHRVPGLGQLRPRQLSTVSPPHTGIHVPGEEEAVSASHTGARAPGRGGGLGPPFGVGVETRCLPVLAHPAVRPPGQSHLPLHIPPGPRPSPGAAPPQGQPGRRRTASTVQVSSRGRQVYQPAVSHRGTSRKGAPEPQRSEGAGLGAQSD